MLVSSHSKGIAVHTRILLPFFLAVSLLTIATGALPATALDAQDKRELLQRMDSPINKNPNDYRLYVSRSVVQEHMGNFEAALVDANKAMQINGRDPAVFAQRANVEMRRKDMNGAIRDYSSAIALDPSRADYFENRGCAYLMDKRYKEARADCVQGLKLDPTSAPAYSNMGELLYKTSDFQNAIDYCTEALRRESNLPDAYFFRGSSYAKLGKRHEADLDLQKAKELGYREGETTVYTQEKQ